jgi:recombination protein U
MEGKKMRYPNSRKTYQKEALHNASRRGMSFETDINLSNQYYLRENRAVVHKKPTPITIVKVDYPKRSAAKITEAYFKIPSTTDYNGIYRGKYIDFEAKECQAKASFPFSSIHPHQVEHLRSIIEHGGIAFLLIRMVVYNIDYLIRVEDFLEFYDAKTRKSLPYEWIQEHGHVLHPGYVNPVPYLDLLDELYFEESYEKNAKTKAQSQ